MYVFLTPPCLYVCLFEISPPLLNLFGRGETAENSITTPKDNKQK